LTHGLNLTAFEIMFMELLELVKIKNCWHILFHFGYNKDLKLTVLDEESEICNLETYYSVNLSKNFELFLNE